jgi:PAS domain S-box-containing protein
VTIPERKPPVAVALQAGHASRASEVRPRSLVEEIQVGVLLQSPTGEVLYGNPKALELLAATQEQLRGGSASGREWNAIHEDGAPFPGGTHPAAQATATRQPVCDVVMGIHRPDREGRVWLLVNASPVLAPDGRVREVVCSFTDITARVLATAALRAVNAQLEERVRTTAAALRAKDALAEEESARIFARRLALVARLAAGVAHQINNPLSFLPANLAWLGAQPSGSEEAQVIRESQEGVRRINRTVRSLSSLARPRSGPRGVSPSPTRSRRPCASPCRTWSPRCRSSRTFRRTCRWSSDRSSSSPRRCATSS